MTTIEAMVLPTPFSSRQVDAKGNVLNQQIAQRTTKVKLNKEQE